MQLHDTNKVEQSLNVIQQSANEMVNRLSDIVWAVNPEHHSLKSLMQKLEEYATEIAPAKNMKVRATMQPCSDEIQLPIEIRHNIFLLCKEAINNAVKYSDASLLELNMRHTDHTIDFFVADNGVGFDPATIKKGNGLVNMQKRAEAIGATLLLKSGPQQGTAISLQCKITQ
jgi:signal transduction histidine kinase